MMVALTMAVPMLMSVIAMAVVVVFAVSPACTGWRPPAIRSTGRVVPEGVVKTGPSSHSPPPEPGEPADERPRKVPK
jgi:hypothetical protein